MAYRVIVIGEIEGLPYCCGVVEFGRLEEYIYSHEDDAKSGAGDLAAGRALILNEEDKTETLLKKVQEFVRVNSNGAAFGQVWFYAPVTTRGKGPKDPKRKYGPYRCGMFRDLLKQLPNVVSLGEAVNPNSGNKIDGYFWNTQDV